MLYAMVNNIACVCAAVLACGRCSSASSTISSQVGETSTSDFRNALAKTPSVQSSEALEIGPLIRKEHLVPTSVVVDSSSNLATLGSFDVAQNREDVEAHPIVWDSGVPKVQPLRNVSSHKDERMATVFQHESEESFLFRRRRSPPPPPPPPPNVDCEWGPWSSWSQCSVTCGNGEQIKKRVITVQVQYDGKDCAGSTQKTQSCSPGGCTAAPTLPPKTTTTMLTTTEAEEEEKEKSIPMLYVAIGGGLLAIVVLGGVAAFFMHSKEQIRKRRRGPLDGNDPFADCDFDDAQ